MQYPDFSIHNKIAMITGASKGIGYGIAKAMAAAGARVILTARNKASLVELVKDITNEGGMAEAYSLDVRHVADIRTVFQAVVDAYGRIDILVNNAGVGDGMLAEDVTEAYWDDMIDVNLKGLFFCCQSAGRVMLKQGFGKIINISSQVSVVGIPKGVVYCASKGGVNQLTKVLALEWSSRGVNINAVGPTFIYTPGTSESLGTPEFRDNVLSRIPAGRIGSVHDVAGAVIYLASPASDLVTGTLLLVDGGWTAQ
ncbi:SDR family NAD(P)-dependent oxidoreductase [Paenibacillus methanolicus]|uniref:NAD(P)-dependent dehydrogenase (Short-subunit alcohol dehydrogenase family) n=1 Tax=Paenibacillus methanolicus TaxID=582686 RepID=A0A5S5CLT4_9BACL|nr:SDR family oxidoreductase [Paenibacillus methanolicus]TYP79348.1 NAD(P)-dependent dehydrogenase (short-subunit alcohol dehydrogenase family) [Paenibacillus methanolicus]